MREILFHGRSIEGRMWYEGDLINAKGNIPPYVPMIVTTEFNNYNGTAIDVDPDTVGQYTGINDMNDKKIFEWDIVKITWTAVGREPVTEIHLVTYSKGCFCVSLDGRPRGLLSNYTGMTGEGYNVTVEVIGNIWDNAELLKGDTDHAE